MPRNRCLVALAPLLLLAVAACTPTAAQPTSALTPLATSATTATIPPAAATAFPSPSSSGERWPSFRA